jgi:hypothetical protein
MYLHMAYILLHQLLTFVHHIPREIKYPEPLNGLFHLFHCFVRLTHCTQNSMLHVNLFHGFRLFLAQPCVTVLDEFMCDESLCQLLEECLRQLS